MEFYAVNGKRPVRLSEETRKFAYESLNYRYGREARKTPHVVMDEIENFGNLDVWARHDAAILKIATEAPIRICEGEKISGAATLGDAISHVIPAVFEGKKLFDSVSHLTVDFETVLKRGIEGIKRDAEEAYIKYKGTHKEAFLKSCLNCLEAFKVWHGRYIEALSGRKGYEANLKNLSRVPYEPAENFYEAVQSLWFTFAFIRLCGNWPGIGRIDWLLGSYLEADLESGRLTLSEAREILAHFFIKGCEWICGGDYGSGDAQHYQNILLAGIDPEGKEVTNAVTYLVLDIIEELGISDFPTTVRVNQNTSPEFLKRVAEVIRLGGGVIAVYNEDLIIESLVENGYDLKEARRFANDGCWEVQIPGKTYFMYRPFDALGILQRETLKGYEAVDFKTFEDLYHRFISDLKANVHKTGESILHDYFDPETGERRPATPCTVVSLFEDGCIRNGANYWAGGPTYNLVSPHIGGLPDVVNSLYAIKKLVFDDKKLEFSELLEILKTNWEGQEELRKSALENYDYYGNDNDEVDEIAADIVDKFADACDEISLPTLKTLAGISTFGRQLEWSPHRLATPNGKKAKSVLAANFSPTPGTDKVGATAVIKSYCKADFKRTLSGAALDVKLLPATVKGDKGLEVVSTLIWGFLDMGGHFMQLDIASAELLREAQKNPTEYSNLSVRVSGWSARFVTLNREWQDMIIAQMESVK